MPLLLTSAKDRVVFSRLLNYYFLPYINYWILTLTNTHSIESRILQISPNIFFCVIFKITTILLGAILTTTSACPTTFPYVLIIMLLIVRRVILSSIFLTSEYRFQICSSCTLIFCSSAHVIIFTCRIDSSNWCTFLHIFFGYLSIYFVRSTIRNKWLLPYYLNSWRG